MDHREFAAQADKHLDLLAGIRRRAGRKGEYTKPLLEMLLHASRELLELATPQARAMGIEVAHHERR